MTIVFIIPNIKAKVIQFPIGELNSATLLKSLGHDVFIVDLRVDALKNYVDVLARADLILVTTCPYDFIQCYLLEQLRLAASTIRRLRKIAKASIYLIGPHGTVLPEPTLECTKADGIIQGEFENGIIQFVNGGQKSMGTRVFLPTDPVFSSKDLSRIKADYSLIRPELYYSNVIRRGKMTMDKCALIFGNRGCPYRCEFCYNFFGTLRIRKPAVIMREIEELYSCYGFKDYFFLDYTFTANKKWVSELCRRIIDSGMKISWICQTRCDRVTRQLLKEMREAGCACIWFGVENPFRPQPRLKNNKSIDRILADKAISDARKAGIVPVLFLQLMQPHEKRSNVEKFVMWLDSVKTYFVVNPFIPMHETIFFKKLTEGINCEHNWSDVNKALERNLCALEALDDYEDIFNKLRDSKWCLSFISLKAGSDLCKSD